MITICFSFDGPDYALKFVNGKSSKPFGRLWWDEIVSTVVRRPQPHNQLKCQARLDNVGGEQLWVLYGDVNGKMFAVGMLKSSLMSGLRRSLFFDGEQRVGQSGSEENEESKKGLVLVSQVQAVVVVYGERAPLEATRRNLPIALFSCLLTTPTRSSWQASLTMGENGYCSVLDAMD
ncbi:hypothetical protein Tco_1315068 [Tanacetum coccineum]